MPGKKIPVITCSIQYFWIKIFSEPHNVRSKETSTFRFLTMRKLVNRDPALGVVGIWGSKKKEGQDKTTPQSFQI